MDLDLSIARIEEAARTIDPVFLNTPQYADDQLGAALGRNVAVKVETANPLRSFKGRGADFFMGRLAAGPTVVCSSTGNFGQAMAYAGRRRGTAVEVFVPENVNPAKLARMRSLARASRPWAPTPLPPKPPRGIVWRRRGTVCISRTGGNRRLPRVRERSASSCSAQALSTRSSFRSATARSSQASHAGSRIVRRQLASSACAPAAPRAWP
jgi:Pyridoxal-phosphate dependent enzyme